MLINNQLNNTLFSIKSFPERIGMIKRYKLPDILKNVDQEFKFNNVVTNTGKYNGQKFVLYSTGYFSNSVTFNGDTTMYPPQSPNEAWIYYNNSHTRSPNINSDYTFSLWFYNKLTSFPSNNYAILRGASDSWAFCYLEYKKANSAPNVVSDGLYLGLYNRWYLITTQYDVNVWCNVTFTSSNNGLYVWYNGTKKTLNSSSFVPMIGFRYINMGYGYGTSAYSSYYGHLSRFRLWYKSITDSEAFDIYNEINN